MPNEHDAPSAPAGVLPCDDVAALAAAGAIDAGGPLSPRQIQPASLDLTLGRRAWRVRASFLPRPGRSVKARLADGLAMHELDLAAGAVLERGCVYLVELREKLSLGRNLAGSANPKSSTGRIDVFVRLVTEGAKGLATAFDQIPPGYEGPLYAEVSPRTFSILVREGSTLNQVRFKQAACAPLGDAELADLHRRQPLVDGAPLISNGLQVSVDLDAPQAWSGGEGPVGWRARRHAALIDVDAVGACSPEDYFDPILRPKSGFIILDPDEFYILASKEALAIPPDYAAEMAAISPGLGEFRVHYAGFFDPGFGWAPGGAASGARAVLEVRSHDAPFVLEHGQPVARLAFEQMSVRPSRLYGADMASNYQGQSLKLSKHFRAG